MGGPFLDDEDPVENPLKDFGVHGGGIPVPPQRKVASNTRRPTRRPFNEPTLYEPQDRTDMLDFAMNTARQGMVNHANAASQINSAISREMDSRVAQEREKRRMEHEKELARMRMQMERERTEAMIRRLGQEQDPMPPGMISRIRIDGKGRVTHG
jgi:hypothetical protein